MKASHIVAMRRPSLLIALAAGLAMSLTSTSAMSARSYSWTIIYYSDATKTEQVGYRECGCLQCAPVVGTQTAYISYIDVMSCS